MSMKYKTFRIQILVCKCRKVPEMDRPNPVLKDVTTDSCAETLDG